jgi:hypothetical protein
MFIFNYLKVNIFWPKFLNKWKINFCQFFLIVSLIWKYEKHSDKLKIECIGAGMKPILNEMKCIFLFDIL